MLPYPDVPQRVPQRFPDQALGGRFNVLCGDGLVEVSSGNANLLSVATTMMPGCAAFTAAAAQPVAEQQLTPQPASAISASASPRDSVLSAQFAGICTDKPA